MTIISTITNLIRICAIVSIILSISGQAIGSKTTWTAGAGGSTDWFLASNWDNGVPTMADSAIITGGTNSLNVLILINSNAEALHITLDQHCILTILTAGIVLDVFSPENVIRINENAQLINYGVVSYGVTNTAFTGDGILVLGRMDNYGTIITDNSFSRNSIKVGANGTLINYGLNALAGIKGIINIAGLPPPDTLNGNGIHVLGLLENQGDISTNYTNIGIFFGDNANGINSGEIKVQNSKNGLVCNGNSFVTNELDGTIDIIDSENGLGNQDSAIFTNNGDLFLTRLRFLGLFNSATFINNNSLKISGIESGSASYGILNQNLSSNTPHFENNMQIRMCDIKSTAIELKNSTTFINNGLVDVSDINGVTKNGLIVKPQANFSITENGSLHLPLTFNIPLDIHLGGVFNVDKGGILDIKN